MGRHRKQTTSDGKVVNEENTSKDPVEAVEDRLGLNGQICISCNARAPADAQKCRKCGSTQLRSKNTHFQNE